MNTTFSSMLKEWGLKWSYSTAFYLGESTFSTILSKRIEEGTELQTTHGGKFQITTTEKGVGKSNVFIEYFDSFLLLRL
jgi:prolyl 4-hydroxylase